MRPTPESLTSDASTQRPSSSINDSRFAQKNHMELSELFSKALALHRETQIAKAIALYQKLLCLRPDAAGVLGLMGTAMTQDGAHANAIRALRRALSTNPTHAATYSNLGLAQKDSNHLDQALASQKNSLVLDPGFFDGLRNLAMTLKALDRPHDGLRFVDFAIQLFHESPEALSLKGTMLGALRRLEQAAQYQKYAITFHPTDAEAHNNLGATLLQMMKTNAALAIIERSLIIQPKSPETWLNRGTARRHLHEHEDARRAFETAIALAPIQAQAYLGYGASLQSDRNYRSAASCLERAHQLDPRLAGALGQALHCQSKALEWSPVRTLLRQLKEEVAHCQSIDSPFPLLTCIDDPQLHLLAARRFARKAYPETGLDAFERPQAIQGRLRIGYFTSDLHDLHPVFKNVYPLLRCLDRDRFELLCFDNSRSGEVAARNLFDEVIYIRSLSDQEVTVLARQKRIDIAIDLNGYTEDARTDVFAARAAPFQINYLGYPGSMGSTYHDFIIADDYVIPLGQDHLYSEKVLRLPSFFMPYDLQANRSSNPPKVRRGDYGLPDDGFIYCSFNDFHKITEDIFHSWIQILQGTDNTVLWLATRGDIGIDAIKAMVRDAGIDPERIIKAHRVESPEEHHARLALADLMLDTFPYNSHTTACDAISVGLPLLTQAGQSFASRVSGSLLSEIGLPSLITSSTSEYVEKALLLAKDPQHYRAVRQAIEAGVDRMPPPAVYTRNLEALLESLVRPTASRV